jgi:hypothetical protein
MWPKRNKGEPMWPTFRGGMLDDENAFRISKQVADVLNADSKFEGFNAKPIYWGAGTQFVRESETGGFLNGGGSRNRYNCFSMELQIPVRKKLTGRKSNMYLILWIGGYGKGSIMHCSWQYPHCLDFEEEDLKREALKVYPLIANLVYGSRKKDSRVQKFIEDVSKL